MKIHIAVSLCFVLAMSNLGAQDAPKFIDGPNAYLGQKLPGNTPVIFAPGIISIPGRSDSTVSFSPDGKMCLLYIGNWPSSYVMVTEFKDGKWTELKKAWFSEKYPVDEPIFSLDGKRIYYSSPGAGSTADIWYVERTADKWGEPVNMGTPINTNADEFHPCIVGDGSFYFSNARGSATVSRFVNGAYQPRKILPVPINFTFKDNWCDTYLPPDESFIFFTSNRPGGIGDSDNYIAFKKADGTWTEPKNMGPEFNSAKGDRSADLSMDGKYIFWSRDDDMYWVKAEYINQFR